MRDETTVTGTLTAHEMLGKIALQPTLTVVHAPRTELLGERLVLRNSGSVVLGRGGAQFAEDVLADKRLSRKHLSLTWSKSAVTLRDLDSHNGSFVNGERVTEARLNDGDVVGCGSLLLLFHRGGASLPSQPSEQLVAASHGMRQVLEQIALVAARDATVLIQGSTGVGKELVAQELHRQSGRDGEFVAVNCGALADGVVHSELFGHARGAFSGAQRDRAGLVAAAAGGTLFLDEVGEATPALQTSLLRLLEQREYRVVGEDRVRTSDARFVAATHLPLREAVDAGRFRQDLLARLSRWTIDVPDLAERPDDIIPLARHIAVSLAGPEVRFTSELTLALLRYDWPSNVRELAAIVERAHVEAKGEPLLGLSESVAKQLQPRPKQAPPATAVTTASPPRPKVAMPSREQLIAAFREANGNMREVGRRLGVSRATTYRWLDERGLTVAELREGL